MHLARPGTGVAGSSSPVQPAQTKRHDGEGQAPTSSSRVGNPIEGIAGNTFRNSLQAYSPPAGGPVTSTAVLPVAAGACARVLGGGTSFTCARYYDLNSLMVASLLVRVCGCVAGAPDGW